MIPKDLFKNIRRIEIKTSRLVSDVFAGQYHSVFKGQGIEFDEVREYQMGDDVRMIDWNVTARTGRPHIKKFIEERELTVMIMVDASASCGFGSTNMLKSQLAAEVSSTLALAAIKNNDKVGLIIFTDKIEKFIPPRKGRQHVLRLVREVLYFEPAGKGTDLVQALEYMNRVTTRKSISFLVSDYLFGADEAHESERVKKTMRIINKKHDLIALTLNDPREWELPDCGILNLEDGENGDTVFVDTTNAEIRQRYHKFNLRRMREREQLFRSLGMDLINTATDQPYADALVKFFLKRKKRRV